MKDVQLRVEITFNDTPDRSILDLGSITLQKDGRECILDVTESWSYGMNNEIVICKVEEDEETFPECKYDLLPDDLYSLDKAEMFIGGDIEELPKYITLMVIRNGNTTAIDLTLED